MAELSREVPVVPALAALLFIDVQNYNCHPDGGEYREIAPELREQRYGYFFKHFREAVLPNMVRLRDACRTAGIEVMYSVIESMTQDGRDRGLDYKITGFHVPRDSWDARVISELERSYRLEDSVIKFMTVRLDQEAPQKPEGEPKEPERGRVQ